MAIFLDFLIYTDSIKNVTDNVRPFSCLQLIPSVSASCQFTWEKKSARRVMKTLFAELSSTGNVLFSLHALLIFCSHYRQLIKIPVE